MTHFLRFPDESTWTAAATEAGFITDDTLAAYTHDRAIDVVGIILIGGTYDPETGDVITPPVVLDGWHVNYQGDLPDAWKQYVVNPEQPVRVWA
jgi:hypothetical protein